MPKLLYSLICSDVIVDQETGSASYIKVFEHGTVPKLPATVPPFFVATLWELEEDNQEPFSVSLALITPNGKQEVLGKNEITPTGATLHKLNFHLPGIKVEVEGRHEITVTMMQGDNRVVAAQMPLHVFLKQLGRHQT